MKTFLRLLILVAAVAVIAGYFFPWISLEISGNKVVQITGSELIREIDTLNELSGGRTGRMLAYIILPAIVSVYVIVAIIKDWRSFLYVLPCAALLGWYLYLIIDSWEMIAKAMDVLKKSRAVMDALSGKRLDLGIGIAGKGLYMVVLGYVGMIVIGVKEMFTREKKDAGKFHSMYPGGRVQ